MKFEISQEQLQSIVNYLITKPYQEVFGLLQMIQAIKPTPKDQTD